MYLFTWLWVVRLPSPSTQAQSTYLSDFRKHLERPAWFAVYILGMKEAEKDGGWAQGTRGSFSRKVPWLGLRTTKPVASILDLIM